MNKKKAIKIATASAIAASGFVAVAPAQAAVKTTNVNTVVNTAISKMAAAYDGYHKPGLQGKIPPTAKIRQLTTNAEAAYDAAVAAIAKDGGTKSQKAAFTKKLNAKKYLLTRAQGYVKAIDVNLNAAKKALDKAVASGKAKDVKAAEAALVKTAATFEKAVKAVYGPSTRKVLVAKYHVPALAKAATVKDELTVYNAYKQIEDGKLIDTNLEKAGTIIAATKATVDKLAAGDKRDTKLVKNLLDAVAKNNAKYNEKAGVVGEVKSIVAINTTTVEVTYKNAVENVDASKYSIEGLTVTNAAVKQTDNKTVILTTSTQEGAKEYTVKSGAVKVGTFKGISAVIPTAVTVTTPSIQGTIGKEVTVKATVTVPEGQSKAGIPVTINIPAQGSLNPAITAEVYTNANGEASYSYTRYSSMNDEVVVYATGDRSKFSTAKVYFADSLVITEVTAGNTLPNGSNKVYKVTGEANTTYNVAYKENLNTTADKLTNVKVVGFGNKIPYQLVNGSSEEIEITTDAKGVASFTLTGSGESVTPIVFKDAYPTQNNKFETTELHAQAPTVTFAGLAYYDLTVKAEGSNYAAIDGGISGHGGRDYTVTMKDKDGKLAKKGEKVYVYLDSTKSKDAYLLDTIGTTGVVELEVENDKGEATFTVYGTTKTSYATPVVFIDRNNDKTYQSTELKVSGEITYFTNASTTSVDVKFYDGAGKEVTSQQASKAVTAEIRILDQNGKLNPVSGTAQFEVTNQSASNLTVNNGTPFSQDTKTFNPTVTNGKASILLNAEGPLTAKINANFGTFATTQSVVFTANPSTVIRGVVDSVDATTGKESITLRDGTKIDLAGLTLRASGSDAVYSVANFLKYVVSKGEIAEFNPTTKTLIVQDTDATGEGEINIVKALDVAKTAATSKSANDYTTASFSVLTTATKLPEDTVDRKVIKTDAINSAIANLKSAATVTANGLELTFSPAVTDAPLNIVASTTKATIASAPTATANAVKDGNKVKITLTPDTAVVATGDKVSVLVTVNGVEKTLELESNGTTWALNGSPVSFK
ncbi:hypothetical protein ABEV54_15360 [Peribacillus psychrosaccharolyticus]|uniref:hypothetical protein n=1 Tax=Peribacillus psychrosaccharolyticus TaxID=1407 RepID=UPI003D2E79A6